MVEIKGKFSIYPKVVSSSTSCLEAHAGFFRLSMKGKVDVYLLRPFENILASAIESCIDQRYLKKMATILFSYYQQRIVRRVLLLTLKFEITQQSKK